TALSLRRRDGRASTAWRMQDISISIPTHCHTVKILSLDRELRSSLLTYRGSASPEDWGRWQNSLECFNQANTDSDNIRGHVEWVLLCSAFEQLLDAKSDAKDVARLFAAALVPPTEIACDNSTRLSSDPKCH